MLIMAELMILKWFSVLVLSCTMITCSSSQKQDDTGYDYLMQMGEEYLSEHKYVEAKMAFESAQQKKPDLYPAKHQLVLTLFQMRDYRSCDSKLDKICAEHPKEPSCPYMRSSVSLELGRVGDSIAYLAKAKELGMDETSSAFYYQRGRILLAQKKNYDAKLVAREGIDRNPGSCELRSLVVESSAADRAFEDALLQTKEYISKCPGAFSAHVWEGYLYFRLRQKDLAKGKFQKILEVFSGTRAENYAREALRNIEQGVALSNPSYLR